MVALKHDDKYRQNLGYISENIGKISEFFYFIEKLSPILKILNFYVCAHEAEYFFVANFWIIKDKDIVVDNIIGKYCACFRGLSPKSWPFLIHKPDKTKFSTKDWYKHYITDLPKWKRAWD